MDFNTNMMLGVHVCKDSVSLFIMCDICKPWDRDNDNDDDELHNLTNKLKDTQAF